MNSATLRISMKFIKNILNLLAALLVFSTAQGQSNGAEITYRCLDANGNFEVTLVYYRDCKNPVICAGSNCLSIGGCSKNIDVYGGDPAYISTKFSSLQVNGVSVRDVFNHAACTNSKSICDNMGCVTPGTVNPAYERYEFKGIVNLGASSGIPSACCNIRFTFSECCRNNTIQTFNSTNSTYYTEASVNRCAATYPNCNSPVFNNDPVQNILAGYPFFFNNGAFDPDMDSLVYSFTPSLEAYNTPVSYTAPYSYTLPMNYTTGLPVFPNGMSCNPVNGDVYFKPNSSPFTGTIALRVDQYRRVNNVITLVGYIRRDVTIKVLSSMTNNQPTIRTIPAGIPVLQPKTNWEVCAGSMICFDVIAKDTDFNPPSISDTTYLSWNKTLEKFGATFLPKYSGPRDSAGPREDSYQFCWTPPDSVANRSNGQTFDFTVTTQDNNCPLPGFFTRSFSIKVFQRASVTLQKTQRDCNRWVLNYTKDPSIIPSQVFQSTQWKIANDTGDWNFSNGSTLYTNVQTTPDVYFSKAGRYLVELSIQMAGPNGVPCAQTFYDTVYIIKSSLIRSSNDTMFCHTGSPLTILVTATDTTIDQYRWFTLADTSNVLVTQTQFNTTANKTVSYLLRGIDTETGCIFSDTMHIKVSALSARFDINKQQQCMKGNSFNFINQSVDTTNGTFTSVWRFPGGDSVVSNQVTGKSFVSVGNYLIWLKIYSASGCSDSTSKTVTVSETPNVQFAVSSDSVQCFNGHSFTFLNQTTSTDGVIYNWILGNGNTSMNADPGPVSYTTPGDKPVKLIATTLTQACQDSLVKMVTVNPSPQVSFTLDMPVQCLNGNLFALNNFSSISSGTLSQQWLFGDGNSNTQPSPMYSYTISGNFSIQLKVTSNLGCKDSSSQNITVNPSPQASFQLGSAALCTNDSVRLTNTTQLNPGTFTSLWEYGDGHFATSFHGSNLYGTAGQYVVELKCESDQNCRDSVKQTLNVHDAPLTPVISGDTLAIRHSFKTYAVELHSGSTYTWNISGDSSRQVNGASVIIGWGPSDGGMVQVVEQSTEGCNSDTAKIQVRVIPNTGMQELQKLQALLFFPQPAQQRIYLTGETNLIHQLEIYSMDGKQMNRYNEQEIRTKDLDVSNLETGMYVVMMHTYDALVVARKISIVK
ncbi:MAG: PKD domain-containing protein [Bacteroidia bacterium]